MKTLFPAFFFWHWSPMNAIEENEFSKTWKEIWKNLEKPKAILAISAHFETNWTFIVSNEKQKIIYDFYWFPKEMYEVKYDVKWDNKLAQEIQKNIPEINLTKNFWLDHWVWSVLVNVFPNADIPIISMSLDLNKTPKEHFELAKKLKYLRENWVMIIWSWNIVHNLGMVDWYNRENAYNWAKEFNEEIKKSIINSNFEKIIDYKNIKYWDYAISGKEHFLPLIYILWLKEELEKIEFFNDKIEMWSLSMTSLKIS